MSNKKRRQIKKNNRKASIGKTSLKKTTFSSLKSFDKKELPVPILVIKIFKSKAKDIDIAIIRINAYYIVCYLKKAQVFAVLIRDI